MTNYEKNTDDIIDVLANDKRFAVNKQGRVCECNAIGCDDCLFYNGKDWIDCGENRIKWLNAEHLASSNEMIIGDTMKRLEKEINKILPEYLNCKISQTDFESKLYFLFSNALHWIIGNIPFIGCDIKKGTSEYIDFSDF